MDGLALLVLYLFFVELDLCFQVVVERIALAFERGLEGSEIVDGVDLGLELGDFLIEFGGFAAPRFLLFDALVVLRLDLDAVALDRFSQRDFEPVSLFGEVFALLRQLLQHFVLELLLLRDLALAGLVLLSVLFYLALATPVTLPALTSSRSAPSSSARTAPRCAAPPSALTPPPAAPGTRPAPGPSCSPSPFF